MLDYNKRRWYYYRNTVALLMPYLHLEISAPRVEVRRVNPPIIMISPFAEEMNFCVNFSSPHE